MLCPSCHSENIRDFTAETNIHFPGMKGLDIPTVWIFPEVSVCMYCGMAQFRISNEKVRELASKIGTVIARRLPPNDPSVHLPGGLSSFTE